MSLEINILYYWLPFVLFSFKMILHWLWGSKSMTDPLVASHNNAKRWADSKSRPKCTISLYCTQWVNYTWGLKKGLLLKYWWGYEVNEQQVWDTIRHSNNVVLNEWLKYLFSQYSTAERDREHGNHLKQGPWPEHIQDLLFFALQPNTFRWSL